MKGARDPRFIQSVPALTCLLTSRTLTPQITVTQYLNDGHR